MTGPIPRTLAAAALTLVVASFAQAKDDTLADIAEKPDKIDKAVWFAPAHASMKDLADIEMPKRLGLLSFYLFDTGAFEFSALAATYGGTYYQAYGLNESGANILASAMAERSVSILKARFAEQGMELLTPIEFLQTAEQKTAYIKFELPRGGLQRLTENVLDWVDKRTDASGAADGYEMIPTTLWSNRDMLHALDELAGELGLDGFVVVGNTTASNRKTVVFAGTVLQVFGPNPIPLPDNNIQARFWTPMIPYATGNYGKGFKGAVIHDWEDGVTSLDGYEVIMDRLARSTLAEIAEYRE